MFLGPVFALEAIYSYCVDILNKANGVSDGVQISGLLLEMSQFLISSKLSGASVLKTFHFPFLLPPHQFPVCKFAHMA